MPCLISVALSLIYCIDWFLGAMWQTKLCLCFVLHSFQPVGAALFFLSKLQIVLRYICILFLALSFKNVVTFNLHTDLKWFLKLSRENESVTWKGSSSWTQGIQSSKSSTHSFQEAASVPDGVEWRKRRVLLCRRLVLVLSCAWRSRVHLQNHRECHGEIE